MTDMTQSFQGFRTFTGPLRGLAALALAAGLAAGCKGSNTDAPKSGSTEVPGASSGATNTGTAVPPTTVPSAAPVATGEKATTLPVPSSGNMRTAQAPSTAPVVDTPPALAEKDTTHVLTEDAPYYKSSPAQGSPADGTFKAGSKVLLLVPGEPYSQVKSQDGTTAYTTTAQLQALGK